MINNCDILRVYTKFKDTEVQKRECMYYTKLYKIYKTSLST